MTYPNTEKPNAEYGGPPEYPTSQMMPPEYWRKQPDGDPDHKQYITVETPSGPQKREIERGWEKPVYLGPEPDEDEE